MTESGYISHWPIWVLILFFLITHDFYIYWFHRLQHHNRYLWRTHEAHHSVRDVDWLAGSRSHAVEILINQTIEFLPIFFLLDINTAAIIVPIKELLDAVWGMWIHANVKVKTGKLQYFINGPKMRQWHHGNHKEVFYANYATKFAFWDWLFGTGFMPGLKPFTWKVKKPISFGLPYDYPQDFFSQTIYAFFRYDFQNIHQIPIIQKKIHLRKILMKYLFDLFGIRSNVLDYLFDDESKSYNIDKEEYKCSKFGHKMKYYFDQNHLKFHCDICNEDLNHDFSKFGNKPR